MSKELREEIIRQAWYEYFHSGEMPPGYKAPWYERKAFRPIVKRLPRSPRCRICYFPFEGIGGYLSRRFFGIVPSPLHPSLCNLCERFATRYQGGVEMEMAVLFIDVRGSTSMAERMTAEAFSKTIQRFYKTVTNSFYSHYGLVEKFQGDEVAGFFVPGFAGPKFTDRALETARHSLKSLGYGRSSGPWIEAGCGLHTGLTYVGSLSTGSGASDISILGDTVNVAARLASRASGGEIILSDAARKHITQEGGNWPSLSLDLKGKTEPVQAWSVRL
jgi:adenylate cyclase